MTDTVLLAIDGPRATITLNDPAKHNRLDTAGLGKLREAIEKADADPNVRVTVLTGTARRPSARATTWARSRRARRRAPRRKPTRTASRR
jgi:enoyl-CoA hydratase/carnithine racemase